MTAQSTLSQSPMTRITVMQGQTQVSDSQSIELTTVLGSCVASCLFDPEAHIGGMNHFLLAEPPASHTPGVVDEHYGVYLMELLINEMLKSGAAKWRIKAHLYGGANLRTGMMPIGTANANFARSFLEQEGIPLVHADLGGNCARRVDFRPAQGRARCRVVENTLVTEKPETRSSANTGDVELF